MKFIVGTVSFPFKTYPCENITEGSMRGSDSEDAIDTIAECIDELDEVIKELIVKFIFKKNCNATTFVIH